MQNKDKVRDALARALPETKIEEDVELAPLTWFKIGGKATFFITAKTNDEVVRGVYGAKSAKIKSLILSGASNVLIDDNGFDGLVILIATRDCIFNDSKIIVDAGYPLGDLVRMCIDRGVLGLNWASGIPGSVGGAVRGNAGAYGGEMKDVVTSVEILRGSKQFVLDNEHCAFNYRDSMFKHNNDVILTVALQLKNGGNPTEMHSESDRIITERKTKHPALPCAGSYFKNIQLHTISKDIIEKLNIPDKFREYNKIPTGWLIDKLDMRGFKVGKAQISEMHGNIIVNTGGATADEVLQLASIMKMRVRDELGIQLEEEVQYVS